MLLFDRWIGFGEVPTVRLQDCSGRGTCSGTTTRSRCSTACTSSCRPRCSADLAGAPRGLLPLRATLVAVSFAGALTFLAFPAAPPWLASKYEPIPHVARIGYIEGGSRRSRPRSRGSRRRSPESRRRRALAARRLRAARAALRVRLARAHRRLDRGSLHARDVVHDRLPGRPLRGRHRRSARPTRWPAGSSSPSSSGQAAAPPDRAFPSPLAPATRAAMFYARGHERRRP